MVDSRLDIEKPVIKERGPLWDVFRRLSKRVTAMMGLVIVLVFLLMALFAPLLAPHDPFEHSLAHKLATPTWDYPLGRDELGRCILSRIIYGARISLLIGLIVISIGILIGVPVGVASAYFGGKVDFIVQRFVDTMLAFPGILLTLLLIAMLGVGLHNVMIAVGISTIPIYARLARSSVLAIKARQYVEASRSIGSSHMRIIIQHLIPNSLSPIKIGRASCRERV